MPQNYSQSIAGKHNTDRANTLSVKALTREGMKLIQDPSVERFQRIEIQQKRIQNALACYRNTAGHKGQPAPFYVSQAPHKERHRATQICALPKNRVCGK
jgi:hypothetical protein